MKLIYCYIVCTAVVFKVFNNVVGVYRRDKILERLVYKIVPGLHAKEMARRALPNVELYLSPDDLVSLVLQYHIEGTR